MMIITLPPDLEEAVSAQSIQQAITPEQVVLDMLREKFLPMTGQTNETDTLSDWEREMQTAAIAVEAVLAKNRTSDEGHD